MSHVTEPFELVPLMLLEPEPQLPLGICIFPPDGRDLLEPELGELLLGSELDALPLSVESFESVELLELVALEETSGISPILGICPPKSPGI